MTTAHRPTFDPARGKEAARGEAYHQRLLPAHKTLKFRQAAQGAPNEQARRHLKAELLKAERTHYAKNDGQPLPADEDEELVERKALEAGSPHGDSGLKRRLSDAAGGEHEPGADGDPEEDYETKKRRVLEETADIDADSASGSSESDESDSDSEDETAELQRELAKIKAERAEAAAREAAIQAKKDEDVREKEIALGNPLLNKSEYGVKRRWDDDVVFKNQARGTEKEGKHFVNDLLRSDFHRKFMDKYVR